MNVWRLITHHDNPEYALQWFKKKSRIAIGWGKIGNITHNKYSSTEDISLAIKMEYPDVSNSMIGGICLYDFCYNMQPGDLIILSTGSKRELVMEVEGEYEFNKYPEEKPLGDYQHQRKACILPLDSDELWKTAGSAIVEGQSIRWPLVQCKNPVSTSNIIELICGKKEEQIPNSTSIVLEEPNSSVANSIQITSDNPVYFDPWIGSNYGSDSNWGISLLILGESYYNDYQKDPLPKSWTSDLIKHWGIGTGKHQFWTKTVKTLTGSIPDQQERIDFWQSVAHYVYVQDQVGSGPRERPSKQMWQNAHLAFKHIMSALKPACVLVIGKELWKNLPPETVNATGPLLCENGKTMQTAFYGTALMGSIMHVSATGYSAEQWHPVVTKFLAEVKERQIA